MDLTTSAASVRPRFPVGSGWVAGIVGLLAGSPGCTDGGAATPELVASRPATPAAAAPERRRNSDGSRPVLPPGPPSRPPHTLVLAYEDFGPQVMAGTLLGSAWWQWEAGGSWELGDRFDVRVVVYRGLTKSQVAAEYRTVEGEADYRYVTYDDAMAYFDDNIVDIEGERSLRSLRRRLVDTRTRVREAMSVATPPP